MGQQFLSKGASAGDGTGTKARAGADIINQNFEEVYGMLDILMQLDVIIEAAGFSLDGQDLTVNANWIWFINNNEYTNPAAVLFEDIPLSASGNKRLVYVVPNNTNGFTLIDGEETTGTPATPYLPNGGMYVTYFEVTDSGIGDLADPYNGDSLGNKLDKGGYEGTAQSLSTRIDQYENYGEKVFKQAWINVTGTGVVADLDLSATASLSLNLTGTVSELQSVFYDSLVEPPYTGSLGFIKNSQAIDVLIPHNELSSLVGRFTFKHPTEKDLVLKPGQVLALKTNGIADGYWEIVGLFLDETNLMNLTDDQDVDGNKNFLQPVSGPTATADEHFVPKAQMDAANAGTLASANAYTDSKVSGTYIFKGNKSNLADIIATGEQVNGYVYNALDTEKNYAWNGSAWDDIGGTFDISGKEDSSNKSNDIEADKASTVKYGNVAAWITWLKNSFVSNLPAKATALVDADLILTGDSEDSFKTKTRTWAQIKATLLAYFETIFAPKSITVVPISSNTTLDDTYNGKVVLLTASCTVTLPNGLATKFGVTIATKAGATLTLAVGGSVTLLNNVGTTMAEKLSCTLLNTGTANEYLTAGNL